MPTTQEEWNAGLSRAKRLLGLDGMEIPKYGEIFLPALPRSELL
jgi:hypothetical protein